MDREEMDRITKGLVTKSAKIRALAEAGVEKADIARYLNVIYQHVYNVVAAPAPKRGQAAAPKLEEHAPGGLTIAEAKAGLAAHFGVPIDAIEITIRG